MRRSTKYGAVDVERWRALGLVGGRVLVAGQDITDRCRWFNDLQGRAEVLVLDELGQAQVAGDDVRVEILEGPVEVIPPDEVETEGAWHDQLRRENPRE